MSTPNRTIAKLAIAIALGLTVLSGILVVGLILQKHGPGNMGNGFLVGAGIGVLGSLGAGWRALRRPQSATTLDRAWTSTGDERDNVILTRALATVGFSAPLVAATVTIALALGAPLIPVLAILNFTFIGIFILAFTVINTRN